MSSESNETASKENFQSKLTTLRTPGLSNDEMLKVYSDWAEKENYESDLLAAGYEAPILTVQYLSESYPKETRNEKKILDIGAGTGMVARGLRAEGFCHIDALDASEAMLSIAKKDHLYENYFCEFITDKALPIEPDTYDGVTAAGCFGPTHIRYDALHELVRIVKPGGIIVIVTGESVLTTWPEFKDRLVPLMDRMEKLGKWKKLVAETAGQYFRGDKAIIWKYQVL